MPAIISRRSTAPRSVADIDGEIEQVDLRMNQAEALAELLRAERDDVIRTGDVDELAAHDARRARAQLEHEIHGARRAVLAAERTAAASAEAESLRRTKFDAGRRAAARAKDIVRIEYPAAAAKIVDILQRLQEAEEVIREANRNLPKGEAAIRDPEQEVRGRPAQRGKSVVSTRTYRVSRRTGQTLISWREDDPDVEVRSDEQVTQLPV